MPDKIRLGVVGTGFGRYGLVPAFRLDPRCEVTAICSNTLAKSQKTAADLGIPHAFDDFRKMLTDAPLDALAIATDPASQGEIAALALDRGKAVFAEKPLAATSAAAGRLCELATQKRLANMVDFQFLEIAAWRRAAGLLREGAIGAVHTCVVNWMFQSYDHRHGAVTWKTDKARGGGVVSHFASHTLYYLEALLGPARSLHATTTRPPGYPRSGETFLSLALTFAGGAGASVAVCSHAPFGNGHRVGFHGAEGSLIVDSPTATDMRTFSLWHGRTGDAELKKIEVRDEPALAPDIDSRVAPLSRLASRFLDWIQTGKPARPDFRDGFRVQTLIDAIYTSSESGQSIELKQP